MTIKNSPIMYPASLAHTSLRAVRSSTLLVVLVAIIAMTAGCRKGRDLTPISGRVLFDGKPLTHGVVTFQPESGQPSIGEIQSDGTFQLICRGNGNGAAVGKNRVRIVCYEQGEKKVETDAAVDAVLQKPLIPKKYFSHQTSGLEVDVRPDVNEPIILNLTKE